MNTQVYENKNFCAQNLNPQYDKTDKNLVNPKTINEDSLRDNFSKNMVFVECHGSRDS
jgi:hypothetical protein